MLHYSPSTLIRFFHSPICTQSSTESIAIHLCAFRTVRKRFGNVSFRFGLNGLKCWYRSSVMIREAGNSNDDSESVTHKCIMKSEFAKRKILDSCCIFACSFSMLHKIALIFSLTQKIYTTVSMNNIIRKKICSLLAVKNFTVSFSIAFDLFSLQKLSFLFQSSITHCYAHTYAYAHV